MFNISLSLCIYIYICIYIYTFYILCITEETKRFAQAIQKDYGKVDILVNNAGITKDRADDNTKTTTTTAAAATTTTTTTTTYY